MVVNIKNISSSLRESTERLNIKAISSSLRESTDKFTESSKKNLSKLRDSYNSGQLPQEVFDRTAQLGDDVVETSKKVRHYTGTLSQRTAFFLGCFIMATFMSYFHSTSASHYTTAGMDMENMEDMKLVVELEDELQEMFALDDNVWMNNPYPTMSRKTSMQGKNGFADIVQKAQELAAPEKVIEKTGFPKRRYKPTFGDEAWNHFARVMLGALLESNVVTPDGGLFEFGVGESTMVAQTVGVQRYVGMDSNLQHLTNVRDKVLQKSPHFRFVWGDLSQSEAPQHGMLLGAMGGGADIVQETSPTQKLKHLPKNPLTYQLAPLMAEETAFDVYIVNGPHYKLASAVAAFLHASARQQREQQQPEAGGTNDSPEVAAQKSSRRRLVEVEPLIIEDTYDDQAEPAIPVEDSFRRRNVGVAREEMPHAGPFVTEDAFDDGDTQQPHLRRRLAEAQDAPAAEETRATVLPTPVVIYRDCHKKFHLPESLFELQRPGRTGFCIFKRLSTTTDEQLVALWNQYQDKM